MQHRHDSTTSRVLGPLLVAAFWALLLFGCAEQDPRPAAAFDRVVER